MRCACLVAAVLTVAAGPGCGSAPDLPVETRSRPLSDRNARLAGPAPAVAGDVTSDRIAGAREEEPGDWLTYYGAYDGQRYSTLDDIDVSNVHRLRPAWTFQHPPASLLAAISTYALEATPLVVDGVMYVSGFDGWVWALDAATGEVYWEYQHSVPLDVPLCCGNVNRGVAVARGLVFLATPNAHLVALDARTGERVWQRAFGDIRAGESATVAPLVVDDLVVVGVSGGEYGIRGHLDAFDLETGERAWRRYTIPAPGQPGSETWPDEGDAWARGGGPAWITGSYDPELDLIYWGVGNPGPNFEGADRTGDNLYTNSVLALRPEDGSIAWHHQFTPHDVWDYDGVNEMILFEAEGRRLLAHFDKNGHLYVLDREDGELLRAVPFARTTWGDVDPRTGEVSGRREPSPDGTEICPGPAGAKEWPHAAYHPGTGLLYAPVIDLCATFYSSEPEFREGMGYWGGAVDPSGRAAGAVRAVDPTTGETAWSHETDGPMVGSLLATGGGLVFAGRPTGELAAHDARTGEPLWTYRTGSGIHGSVMTYEVDGTQYVAVPSGWGGWLPGFAPGLQGAPRGAAIFAFALP